MRTILKTTLAAILLATVAACGQPGSGNDAAANDQPMMGNDSMENGMMSDPSNPYAQAEMKMNEAMMAAVGTDVSDTWVKKMIEHHRGAVEMSNIALAEGVEGKVREMVQMTITKQTREMGEFEAMVKQGTPSQESASAYRPAETQMHDAMMAAKGANASEAWIRKMIEHHRGAIALSEIVIAQGQDTKVKEKARKAAADQRKEVAELERLLSGDAGTAAPAAAQPAPSADPGPPAAVKIAPVPPKAPPKAAPKADVPKAPPKPKAPPPAADPHAGHDMNKM